MHKLVVLYPDPADRVAFVEYYTSTHLPLAKALPGLRAWRYSTEVAAAPGPGAQSYFALFEADFDSAEAFREAMASPQGQAVAADVPNYATGGAVVLDYAVVGGGEA